VDGIGERLKEERLRNGWSQKDLARESETNVDTISGIETGQHEPRPSTLRKLAKALSIEVRDLFEEPVPLGEAPREAGQLAEEPEEEQHIPSIHPSALEEHIAFIKRLKEQREAEIEEVKQGAMPRVLWGFHLEADNKYLEIIHRAAGISAFVEEVTAGRRMAAWPVQRLCHELSRHLSDFLKLADEAKVLDHQKQSDTYVEGVKGMSEIERQMQEGTLERQGTES
jgi:transcriptional regulator with XRE-family HTH domain